MDNWAIIGVIVAIMALVGSILMHLFKTTWWMATLTSSLNNLSDIVKEIKEKLVKFEVTYCTKEESDKSFARLEMSIQAAHRRLDEIKHLGA